MKPTHSVEISMNLPAIILIAWAFCRLFLRWFGDYYYTEFGMVLDLIAIIVLLHLVKGVACQDIVLKSRHKNNEDL